MPESNVSAVPNEAKLRWIHPKNVVLSKSSMPPTLTNFYCDVSPRGKLQLTGEDRVRFLNGQVTNDVKALASGRGCYATFTNGKGKIRADAVILNLANALWVDLEPGCDVKMAAELEKFLIADDVHIQNLTEAWRAYTLVGPMAADILREAGLCVSPPTQYFEVAYLMSSELGDGFLYRSHRARTDSFDIRVEQLQSSALIGRLSATLKKHGGDFMDANALEIARIEAGIPRFGAEMDENTIPPEAGLESLAISYTKGCYLGQEVIARIKSVGHVNRTLVRLKLPPEAKTGDSLIFNEREVGKLGSAVVSSSFGPIGLAIIRREAETPGTKLSLPQGEAIVTQDFS